MSTPIF